MSRKAKRSSGSYNRTTGTKEITKSSSAAYLMASFAHLQEDSTYKNSQSFEDWEREGLLSKLMVKIKHINQLTLREAMAQKIVAEYKSFPAHSHFSCPKLFKTVTRWGVIKNIGGQKPRVAGFFEDNIFQCVFLDKDHHFYPTNKRNT